MGSSARSGPAAKPVMGTTVVPGAKMGSTMKQKYYTDINDLPVGGGLMKGSGAGLNWTVPPPRQPRWDLASLMSRPGFSASSGGGGGRGASSGYSGGWSGGTAGSGGYSTGSATGYGGSSASMGGYGSRSGHPY